ncbi:PEP-CTERM sorting domain-containing protein [Rubripirellula tenax]|nr:PEP-CTERM sorting domain-containing protein [Rubripirellula tenax]
MFRLTALLTLLLTANASYVNADFVDSFDVENGGTGVLDYTNFENFVITAGSVDLLGNGFFDYYPGNGLYLDLNGTSGGSGSIETNFDIAPGLYRLSFNLGNNRDFAAENMVTVSLDGYSETFSRTGVVSLESIERLITVTSSSRLSFVTPSSDADLGGIVLDSVAVTSVPEPSSSVMLAALAFSMFTWRRHAKRA